jgi:hypothetical protein
MIKCFIIISLTKLTNAVLFTTKNFKAVDKKRICTEILNILNRFVITVYCHVFLYAAIVNSSVITCKDENNTHFKFKRLTSLKQRPHNEYF